MTSVCLFSEIISLFFFFFFFFFLFLFLFFLFLLCKLSQVWYHNLAQGGQGQGQGQGTAGQSSGKVFPNTFFFLKKKLFSLLKTSFELGKQPHAYHNLS